jgi:polysaccharide biosynthesis/export protein
MMSPQSLFRSALFCLSLSLLGSNAQAQFNGPALTVSSSVNVPQAPTTDPALLFPAKREVRLAPGDQIMVHIYGSLDYNPTDRVAWDGSIQLPLTGKLDVRGMTVSEAEQLIARRLMGDGMYRNPQVTIQILDSPNQVATVAGEVHGVVPIIGQRRLMEVISLSGGFPPLASHVVTIQRPGVDQPIIVDLGNDPAKSDKFNVPIFAGDTILVSRTGVIYMLGAFKTVGAIPLQQNTPLTLMQATSLAGGAGFEGKFKELQVIRTIGANRTVVQLDLKGIMKGTAPDPVLQTDDIVYLPSNMIRAAIKSGGLSTVVGIGSILAVGLRN